MRWVRWGLVSRLLIAVWGLVALLGAPAHAQTVAQTPSQASASTSPILVFAAASLRGTVNEALAAYTAQTGRRAVASYAASSALARQIEQGAPADIFASADLDWMDWLSARDLVRPDTQQRFLGNRLVLIAPRDSAVALTIAPGFPIAAAIGAGRIALGEPNAVPAGRYARAAFETLGVWEAIRDRVAGAENVSAALALVARGEAALGVVYATDAAAEPRVRTVGIFPDSSHPRIVYPFAVTRTSSHPHAGDLMIWLASPAARDIFARAGFILRD